jgi:hypothetical protein
VIRRNRQTGEVSLDPLRWGLIPYWCVDPRSGRRDCRPTGPPVAIVGDIANASSLLVPWLVKCQTNRRHLHHHIIEQPEYF